MITVDLSIVLNNHFYYIKSCVKYGNRIIKKLNNSFLHNHSLFPYCGIGIDFGDFADNNNNIKLITSALVTYYITFCAYFKY